jgi:Ca2+-transporting ATPase
MMATVHGAPTGFRVAVKGAPEAVIERATQVADARGVVPLDAEARARWLRRSEALGVDGLRVLAVAHKHVAESNTPAYTELTLLGLVGLLDPARASVRPAIERCRAAGVRVVMVTGDQAGTALNVARSVGLVAADDTQAVVEGHRVRAIDELNAEEREAILNASVVARTSPEQKLNLLALYRQAGAVVAMLGDGVNDAPALRAADIGVAMGRRGTQVAREAAAMVLEDDELGTIAVAIEQGRVIFANIRKFVVYLVSCNLSEILTVGLATLVSAPLPILPLQILFLNLVTDVFPALALGVGEGAPGTMQRPPRDPGEPFLAARHWRWIVAHALLLAASVLLGLALAVLALHMPIERAVTVSFLILAFGQLVHVFNAAESTSKRIDNEVVRNPWVWHALWLCVSLVLGALYLPFVSDVLRLRAPDATGWMLVIALSFLPLVLGRTLLARVVTLR